MVVVGLDDGHLAAGLQDRCHCDDMAVIWVGEAWQVFRGEVVSARDPGEGPLSLFGEIRQDHDIARLEPVGFGVEESAIAPDARLVLVQLLSALLCGEESKVVVRP